MLVIGLTGKTGAGKSTVASYLKEKGCFVIDGDLVAREIVMPSSPALKELAEAFGKDIILEDGSLDRKALAQKAFSSAEGTALLNRITHPHIKARFEELLAKASKEGFAVAVIDAAALLESDCKDLCEKIIVVHADEQIRLERILSRDRITYEQAMTRINGQKDDNYYLRQADIIIFNNADNEALFNEFNKLKELTR
ncbi:MAG: dephospho-CoA kinase [Clostridia bacterium]|nr:dephospho-CoA kinase [Clostridia bacterium]